MYLEAINTLLKTSHFLPKTIEEQFEIADEDPNAQNYVDVGALVNSLENIEMFVSDGPSQLAFCAAFLEANYFGTLVAVPAAVKVINLCFFFI